MCFEDSATSPAIFVLKSWMLYEKPGFLGRAIALEEGPTDHLVNMWAEEGAPMPLDPGGQPIPTAPMVIGSIRLVVRVSESPCFLSFMQLLSTFPWAKKGSAIFVDWLFLL